MMYWIPINIVQLVQMGGSAPEEEHDSRCKDSDDKYDLPLSRRAKSHLKSAKVLRGEAEADLTPNSSADQRHDKQSCIRDKPICLTKERLGAEMHMLRNGTVSRNSPAYEHREAAIHVDVLGNSYTLSSSR
ncbi:hypothetical protein QYM36_006545 [Artemia franciscana]|uniref:Uncharacterized protein n=1 Tax=Artemia franciscana TaxID=6661 RepID=A0AA88HXS1_ARTSF|nr:hypothetical protein QYM36_006545 [Artemia franciscana]